METFKMPFYAKATLIFIGLIALFSVLYIGQNIIVPLIYAIVIAIALSPMVDFFASKKTGRITAIAITLTIVFLTTIVFFGLLSTQMSVFAESFPKLLDKFYEILNNTIGWCSGNLGISSQKINAYVSTTKEEIMNGSRSVIGSTISTIGSALVVIFLIPVYVFMLLFYRPLLLDFVRRIFGVENQAEVNSVLSSTKTIIQKYLGALVIEAAIIATLNSVGLLIIGIDYAIALGVIGAILNVIPYVGGIVAVALPMMIALVTKSSSTYPLLVLALYIVIQFIDNHYVIPKVVASKVKINALISIIVILLGNALWGLPGMFLSIPLTAILKVICDHIEDLKPWGFLLGDTMPTISFFKIKTRKKPVALVE